MFIRFSSKASISALAVFFVSFHFRSLFAVPAWQEANEASVSGI